MSEEFDVVSVDEVINFELVLVWILDIETVGAVHLMEEYKTEHVLVDVLFQSDLRCALELVEHHL